MKSAPLPDDELLRLAALEHYRILDTAPEQVFDDLTELAAHICEVPIALVSLIDTERQWFKSRVGLEARETPRDIAFCAHAILGRDLFVVNDTLQDDRFADNPLVTGDPAIRFYAGSPLFEPGGQAMGTLCVIDREPRRLTPEQEKALHALARQAVSQMELRKKLLEQQALNDQLRAAEAQAVRANRTKSRFLAHMSHEFRTPLNAIIGFSKVLRKTLGSSADQTPLTYLQRITTNGLHLLELVNNLLDLSRIEANQLDVRCEPFNLDALIEETAAQVEPLVMQQGNTLEVHGAGATVTMTSDRTRIRQCLLNLLSNACKFTESGSISLSAGVETRAGAPWVRLTVEDTGCGMSSGELARVFNEFYRADHPDGGQSEGTGLGLAITQKFCELLGGTVSARSEPGVGSTFVIGLPLTGPVSAAPDRMESRTALVATASR